jgi:hypothetical protein
MKIEIMFEEMGAWKNGDRMQVAWKYSTAPLETKV